ncbi:hypothetical protein [Stutzerimonas stutzeri]|uniref:hypothetical protein n=1 Tax=Stutzerimonas stutzeri TaxID=316 RepID=UPI0002911D98|nr:hypothetical protein [Stutzerimonas stutzeri]
MTQIANGFVQGVVDKGEGDKAFAIIGISITKTNRNGFEETAIMEFTVRGEQFKNGLHNVYRQLKGTEVYAPYSDEIDTYYKDNPRIRYTLGGIPLRLQEALAGNGLKQVDKAS